MPRLSFPPSGALETPAAASSPYITPLGYARLQKELETLWARPELAWTYCDYADTLLQRNEPGDREKGHQQASFE